MGPLISLVDDACKPNLNTGMAAELACAAKQGHWQPPANLQGWQEAKGRKGGRGGGEARGGHNGPSNIVSARRGSTSGGRNEVTVQQGSKRQGASGKRNSGFSGADFDFDFDAETFERAMAEGAREMSDFMRSGGMREMMDDMASFLETFADGLHGDPRVMPERMVVDVLWPRNPLWRVRRCARGHVLRWRRELRMPKAAFDAAMFGAHTLCAAVLGCYVSWAAGLLWWAFGVEAAVLYLAWPRLKAGAAFVWKRVKDFATVPPGPAAQIRAEPRRVW